jgi:hypothetical protein
MGGVRRHLSYANVMATVAVFIALGGGAYALTRGEVKSKHIARDAVKAKHIDFGVRSVPMMASHAGLPATSSGNDSLPVMGVASVNAGIWELMAPTRFVATGLRVRQGEPLDTGSRTWTLQAQEGETSASTALKCTVDAGERTCRSNARVTIPAGSEIWWRINSQGTTGLGDYALVSWRAVLP